MGARLLVLGDLVRVAWMNTMEEPTQIQAQRGRARDYLRAMRPHQWAKNLLLFVPLVTSHQVGKPSALARAFAAFIAFSVSASAVYVINDLLDVEADRRHPTKRLRPFASGALTRREGVVMATLLMTIGLALSLWLPWSFVLLLMLYLALTTSYSAYLKRKFVVDVITLAGLYTLRILAGGAAEGIVISSWLMAFSVFFFLSLAFVKRYTEIDAMAEEGHLEGRGYRTSDLDLIRSMGPTSGYMSVVVLCLYINSREVTELYGHPEGLWLLCPVLLYWVSRIWFIASRRELDSDPVLFAVRDRISYLAGAVMVVVLMAST
jgi:4-hydroxybenzoate polyprenyltransferase